MKRTLTSLFVFLAIGLGALAQGKLTPQAQLAVKKHQLQAQRAAARGTAHEQAAPDAVKLVVQLADDNVAQTCQQLRAAGATLRTKLGHQVTVSIPVDSIGALERIGGVVRIDKGHRGRLKTDVARQATGIAQLNGPTLPAGATEYSGRGVNFCIFDVAMDFQHPAFKDAQGRSRIKAVYVRNSTEGRPFTVSDPEAGEYTFPGSIFDTPELIATLTTDDEEETHGTHTTAIAAGSISEQGFGGMAPDADLVLIPSGFFEEAEDEYDTFDEMIEEVLAFAAAYADQSEQPTVFSASMNSHEGPHDGTSTVTAAIEELSNHVIPVFSTGNEGAYPIHLYQEFTAATTSVKTLLMALTDGDDGHAYKYVPTVVGYTRTGSEVSLQLTLKELNQRTGRLTTKWTSEKVTATLGGEPMTSTVSSDDDETLAAVFDGEVSLAAMDNGDGRLFVSAEAEGGMDKLQLFELVISGAEGTAIDLWDQSVGFGGRNFVGLPGYIDGDSDLSAGDWTTTDRVVSVGAYCTNVMQRNYDGTTIDTTNDEDMPSTPDDIAVFSSYGQYPNGICQPVVCAPGVNIVSAWNSYSIDDDETIDATMQWQGGTYSAESGTSMACPVVSGIIATWLQASPTLTLDDVKDIISYSATNDDYTAQEPLRWGAGKINAAKGIEYILQNYTTGIREMTAQPADGAQHVYDLQGRRLQSRPQSGLYIHEGKKFYVK